MVFTCRPLGYPCSGTVAGLSGFVGCRASYGTINTVNRACSTLGGGDSSVSRHWRWPWVFEQPGKCAELPEEEVFAGFDGIDTFFADEFFDLDDSPQNAVGVDHDASDALWSTAHSKVSREVRNACHSPVSLDAAPAAKLVVLSRTGAALTGIPHHAVRAARNEEKSQHTTKLNSKHKGVDACQEAAADSPTAVAEDDAESGTEALWSRRERNELALALTGTSLLEGSRPFAACYGGHQFGNWAGQLGDGRVATLGEIRSARGRDESTRIAATWDERLVEIQLKGIGKTPFSRGGDGKAVLGACLREYLFSEAFIGLGLGAAVAISVCATGENPVIRESDPAKSGVLKRAPGAVLCRTAPSFLRFGSFELPARRGEADVVKSLADYCLRHLSPHIGLPFESGSDPSFPAEAPGGERSKETTAVPDISPAAKTGGIWQTAKQGEEGAETDSLSKDNVDSRNDYLKLLVAIVQATARMVAAWQALGFCHGVLNTDNFTVLGLGLDFGPCSFMEQYNPSWSPNEGDSALRYKFQNQPDVSAWNCERLADSFSSLVGYSGVAEASKAFSPAFDAAYTDLLQRKLGLTALKLGNNWIDVLRSEADEASETTREASPDAQFVLELFRLMAGCRADFTDTWRALSDVPALSVALHTARSPGLPLAGRHQHRAGVDASNKDGSAGGSGRDWEMSDDELLRPLRAVLKASGASSAHMRDWATWTRKYMARIDSQGIGTSHPEGMEAGRRERLKVMRASSPAFVLRASTLAQAIKTAEEGDMSLVHQLEDRLASPYATKSCCDTLVHGPRAPQTA